MKRVKKQHLSYVSNGAVGFDERERTTIFLAVLRRVFAKKELELVFRLEFSLLFFQEKRS